MRKIKQMWVLMCTSLMVLLFTACTNNRESEIKVQRMQEQESKDIEMRNEFVESDIDEETESLVSVVPESTGSIMSEPEELLDAFLASEIEAFYDNRTDTILMSELLSYSLKVDGEDHFIYSVGERVDLDNDGENELIINGPYGGIYFDARDGKVCILAEGEGTTGLLSYTYYDNAVWIVHSDVLHAGRKMYWLTKYDGEGNIIDEFLLSAEYWDSPYDGYDENSIFTYRGEEISMTEYEELKKEIMESGF